MLCMKERGSVKGAEGAMHEGRSMKGAEGGMHEGGECEGCGRWYA